MEAPPQYDLIVADPPWNNDRPWMSPSDEASYPRMTLKQLKQLPVASWVSERSVLLMWALGSMMKEAQELLEAWGFSWRGIVFTWVKQSCRTKKPIGAKPSINYPRKCCEYVLVGVRGKAPINQNYGLNDVIFADRREHSRKPEEFWAAVEHWLGDTYPRRLEMFAREKRPGWEVWGNQVSHFDEKKKKKEEEVVAMEEP